MRCVDISPDIVWVATDGGLWRFSRYNGQALDPWYVGTGIEEAIPLVNSKIVLWHEASNRLWVATNNELLYWRPDFKLWYRFESNRLTNKRITSLGEAGDKILVELDGSPKTLLIIDPFSGLVNELKELPPGKIRWTGRAGMKSFDFSHFLPYDFSLRFDSNDGSITDWEQNVFKPVFERLDRNTGKRYICYPGLGLVVANEMKKSFKVLQLGPSGVDVKTAALSEDGFIWLGGNNSHVISGFSTFDRKQGNWNKYNSKLIVGLDSHIAHDILISGGTVFFATTGGLVRYDISDDNWRTLDRFDGLRSNNLSTLSMGSEFLFIGGDNGINRYTLPNGPMWQISYERAIAFNTYDLIADNEHLWAAGQQGAFRIPSKRIPERDTDVLEIENEPVTALTIVDDKMWIASHSGVRAIDKNTGTDVVQLGYHGYLYCKNVLALEGDDKYLWIGTTSGLIRYDYTNKRRLAYGKKQGLPHNRIQCLKLEADSLWIGTPEGLTRFIWNRPERDGDY